jgi:hypothetical protein
MAQAMIHPTLRSNAVRAPWSALVLATVWAGGCGPIWILDPPTAEKMAKQDKKPLMLYFKTWDSSQHRNMRMQVFSNAAVAKEMQGTVNVELEFAFSPDYRNRYGVRSPQVCVMCTPDGRKVGTPLYVNPVPTPDKFLEWLRAAKQEALSEQAASPPAGGKTQPDPK